MVTTQRHRRNKSPTNLITPIIIVAALGAAVLFMYLVTSGSNAPVNQAAVPEAISRASETPRERPIATASVAPSAPVPPAATPATVQLAPAAAVTALPAIKAQSAAPASVIPTAAAAPHEVVSAEPPPGADVVDGVIVGSFTVPTKVPKNEMATVYFACEQDSLAAVRAYNRVVCFFHYPNQDIPKGKTLRTWAKETKALVWCVYYNSKYSEADLTDLSMCYYYPESGTLDALRLARQKINDLFTLKNRPMVAFGESGGASAAENMVVVAPEMFSAVALVGGRRFGLVKSQVPYPWLILHSRFDDLAATTLQLTKQLEGVSYYLSTQPLWQARGRTNSLFSHCANGNSHKLVLAFIGSMLGSITDGSKLSVPPPAEQIPTAYRRLNTLPYSVSAEFYQELKKSVPMGVVFNPESGKLVQADNPDASSVYLCGPPMESAKQNNTLVIIEKDAWEVNDLYDVNFLCENGYAGAVVGKLNETLVRLIVREVGNQFGIFPANIVVLANNPVAGVTSLSSGSVKSRFHVISCRAGTSPDPGFTYRTGTSGTGVGELTLHADPKISTKRFLDVIRSCEK